MLPLRNRRLVVVVACLGLTAVAGAACGDSTVGQKGRVTSTTRDPWDAAWDAPVFTGTFAGLSGSSKTEARIDVGGKYPVTGTLALVRPLDCSVADQPASGLDRWEPAALAAIPIGTRVIVARNQEGKGRDFFVHPADANGAPTGPSLNEALAVAGVAAVLGVTEPGYGEKFAEAHARHAVPSYITKEPDVTYWHALHAGWMKAWEQKAGEMAICVAEYAKDQKAWAQYQRELKEYEPGGKYYAGKRGSGGSGGVNLPNFGDGYCDTCVWLRRLF